MEKILLAIDAKNLDMPALDFACFIGRLTNSKITGIFLENLAANETPVLKKIQATGSVEWEKDETSADYRDKKKIIEKNISLFKEACEKRAIRCSVHNDGGLPADEIIKESRYADLVIADAATSFHKTYEGTPTEFVKDILQKSECPVIIAPESFDGIDEIVFTYDNSKSSVFAIKQFTFLLPELGDRRTIILQVNETQAWTDKDKNNFREWLQNHYSAIDFEILDGNIDDKLFDYLFKRKNVFIVMGAYGRNAVSRFFRKSHADRLIKTITQPIFIAHY
jgi:nucleotide-binding universal stress UspA family protein